MQNYVGGSAAAYGGLFRRLFSKPSETMAAQYNKLGFYQAQEQFCPKPQNPAGQPENPATPPKV